MFKNELEERYKLITEEYMGIEKAPPIVEGV